MNNKNNKFKRKTYYLRDDQVEKLRKKAFYERKAISNIVREALDVYLIKTNRKLK